MAERVSTRIAGLLSGYPLGTALALAFIGIEISPEFAARGAVYTLAGFSSTLALGFGYWLCGRAGGLLGFAAATLWLLVSTGLQHWWLERNAGIA